MDPFDLPDENDAIIWGLLNVVGLPASLVWPVAVAIWAWGWIRTARDAARGAGRIGSRLRPISASVLQARPAAVLLGTIVAQSAMITASYVLGQMFQVMLVKNESGRYLADGTAYDLTDTLRLALDYNHWTPVSLRVVQGAVAFVILVDLLCLLTERAEAALLLVTIPALGLAGLAALVGLGVLILGLTNSGIYTVAMAGLYGLWVVLLLGWSKLVKWTIELPRLLVGPSASPTVSPRGGNPG